MRAFFTACFASATLGAISASAPAEITPLPTSTTALIGAFARGPFDLPVRVGADEFESQFGSAGSAAPASWPAELQARQFFLNGGAGLVVVRISDRTPLSAALMGNASNLTGLHALEPVNDLRLLVAPELSLIPGAAFGTALAEFRSFLERRHVFLIMDPPPNFADTAAVVNWVKANIPDNASWGALYFPYLDVRIQGTLLTVGASGAMAAVYGKTDSTLGIWKSPAGTSVPLQAEALHPIVSQNDADTLNVNQISSIRQFPGTGIVPWGVRTLDRTDPENRYVPVVRARNWITASIERSLASAAVEENGPVLWAHITHEVQAFLQTLFLQGAFAGATAKEAYFVRCDSSTTTAADVAAHRVKVLYGVAMLRASEFDLTEINVATKGTAPSLPVLHQRVVENRLQLAYLADPGFDYNLEVANALSARDWKPVGTNTRGDGTWRTPNVLISGGNAFYRLRVEEGQ